MSLATSAAAGRWLASPTRRPWMLWRSPKDQPALGTPRAARRRHARPPASPTAGGSGTLPLEPFYGAAVRSMGSSWHDFAFGAVDPASTVTLESSPGAFSVQALFVRLLGFHYWVVHAFPQVLAGVLHRARALSGRPPSLAARGPASWLLAVFAASPAATLAMRGTLPTQSLSCLSCWRRTPRPRRSLTAVLGCSY